MSLLNLFGLYAIFIAIASLFGGKLPDYIRLSHTRMQVIMSFVAGLMLGVACYRLLPHAIFTMTEGGVAHAVEASVWWLMIGLVLMFILLRTFHFHQHEPEVLPESADADHAHEQHDHHHGHEHGHPHDHRQAHPLSWAGVAIGLTLHTLIDGIALGAAIKADVTLAAGGLVSLGVFVAVLLHKPLDAMSITSLMRAGGYGSTSIRTVNLLFALMCPLGALLFFWGVDWLGEHQSQVVGAALAFSAGVFLCISLSDLLPEVQFHSHDSFKLTIALILGIALAYGISHLEPEGEHGHSHGLEQEHGPERHEHDHSYRPLSGQGQDSLAISMR